MYCPSLVQAGGGGGGYPVLVLYKGEYSILVLTGGRGTPSWPGQGTPPHPDLPWGVPHPNLAGCLPSHPLQRDMGAVEVLWDGDGYPHPSDAVGNEGCFSSSCRFQFIIKVIHSCMWEEPGQPRRIHVYTVYTTIGGKGRCHTSGESEESVVHRRGRTQARESTLALKPRANITRSPKQVYQWPYKNLKTKKKSYTFMHLQ